MCFLENQDGPWLVAFGNLPADSLKLGDIFVPTYEYLAHDGSVVDESPEDMFLGYVCLAVDFEGKAGVHVHESLVDFGSPPVPRLSRAAFQARRRNSICRAWAVARKDKKLYLSGSATVASTLATDDCQWPQWDD
jgi:hypothetical protein